MIDLPAQGLALLYLLDFYPSYLYPHLSICFSKCINKALHKHVLCYFCCSKLFSEFVKKALPNCTDQVTIHLIRQHRFPNYRDSKLTAVRRFQPFHWADNHLTRLWFDWVALIHRLREHGRSEYRDYDRNQFVQDFAP